MAVGSRAASGGRLAGEAKHKAEGPLGNVGTGAGGGKHTVTPGGEKEAPS